MAEERFTAVGADFSGAVVARELAAPFRPSSKRIAKDRHPDRECVIAEALDFAQGFCERDHGSARPRPRCNPALEARSRNPA